MCSASGLEENTDIGIGKETAVVICGVFLNL
jgi:hypothetical protein